MKIKPRRLRPGDTIALVTPSWAGPSAYPWVYELGVQRLKDIFDINIIEYPSTRASSGSTAQTPISRAADINQAFADPKVQAIISTIGGEDSMMVLKYIDFASVAKHPKIFMGYSDTTTLLTALNLNGIVTFHGPSIMSGFAEPGTLQSTFIQHMRTFFYEDWHTLQYAPYSTWTEDLCHWDNRKLFNTPRKFHPAHEWRGLHGSESTGELFGGCIEVLEFLKGSAYWPTLDFWHKKILLLETSEEVPDIKAVRRILRSYGVQEIFTKISGILFGRARGYTDDQKDELDAMIVDVVTKEFDATHVSIMTDLDFGHTDPQIILPLGCSATMNPIKGTLTINESPFLPNL